MTDGEALAKPILLDLDAGSDVIGPVARKFQEIAPELRRFLLGVLRDPELVDDVMQATIVKGIENGGQARLETLRGWLFQVAFHEAMAVRRQQLVRFKGQTKLAALRIQADNAPDAGLVRGELVSSVRAALQRIPEDQRAVILARIYEEKTFAEIASQMGLPLGTVLTRMRRGLQKLRHFLKPGGPIDAG